MRGVEFVGELQRWAVLRPKTSVALELAVGMLLSLGLLWGFLELTEEVLEGESRGFDRAMLLWVEANLPEWLDGPMRLITAIGYFRVVLPLLAVVAFAFYRAGHGISAALLVASTSGSILITTMLKGLLRRDRPSVIDSGYEASFYSFPSGHATVAVGFYGALALLLVLRLESPWRRMAAVAGAALVVLIGLSRLYLGVHYPTDVLAGYLAASLWLASVWVAWRLWRLAFPPDSRPRKLPA